MKRRQFLIGTLGAIGGAVTTLTRAQSSSPCPPPMFSAGGQSVSTACSTGDAETDWLYRSGQSGVNPDANGVVWFHDFRTDAEVDNFRWTSGVGNDPNDVGRPNTVRRNTQDGITGACLEIHRNAGGTDPSTWWRPFAPLTAPGNGLSQNDPAAGGSLTVRSYSPTQGGGQIANMAKGYYGHPSYHIGDTFDGTEYYVQARVKIDPNRIAGTNGNGGKLFFFTRTDKSLTSQEIVTNSAFVYGGKSRFRMYRSGGTGLWQDLPGTSVHGNHPGTEYGSAGDGLCRFDDNAGRLINCWAWPLGEWVTVLYHVRPGLSGNNDTWVRVWVAARGVTSYTKIWDQPGVDLPLDVINGHNALICSAYMNGDTLNINTAFYHRFCQLIFSKSFIPCPNV